MRFRQHTNPLRADLLAIVPDPVRPPPGVPVDVELGSAEGHFLIEHARLDPGAFCVGIEIRKEWAERANRASAREGLPHVVSVFANMNVDLSRVLPRGRVRRFFLNFPDPWFKARQHKRRVLGAELGPALAAEMHAALAPDGEVFVATDVFALALDAMAVLEAEPPRRFENLRGPWRFLDRSPVAARSRRERECEAQGLKIWRLGFRRRG
jgi:tRNA (guanine-N7-)-methyltransferase